MITSLDRRPHNPLNTDSWDGYGAERRELVDHGPQPADVAFVTGDIHTFFTGHVTRNGRYRGVDPARPGRRVRGRHRHSPGIADRAANSEPERLAAAAPLDAAVLANNPQIVYSNQAYKGYGLVEAGDDLRVRYQAVREHARQHRARRSRCAASGSRPASAAVIDEGGPLPA